MSKKRQEEQILDLFEPMPDEGGPADRDQPTPAHSKTHSTSAASSPAMLLESVAIHNLWAYDYAEVGFDDGITVIAGLNGSGKSSLLESIFFALYGSRAGPAMDRKLDDVLRIGQDSGSVALKFRYGPHRYTAQMALRRRGDNVISDKESCLLVRDDDEKWIGVETAAQAIEELFGMNRDDFTNCVYIRQGEIDRLIRASGDERRQMIDRLLRLEKLDQYVQRAKDGARRAVNRRLDVLTHLVIGFKREVDQLESTGFQKRLGDLEEQVKTKQSTQKSLDEKLVQAEAMQQSHNEQWKRIEEHVREVKERSAELAQKEKLTQQNEARDQALSKELEELKKRYTELRNKLSKRLDELELPKEAVINSIELASIWEEVTQLSSEYAQAKTRQEALHSQLQEMQREGNLAHDKLIKKREEFLKNLVQKRTQSENFTKELSEMKSLIAEGKCPICRQPVKEESFGSKLEEVVRAISKLKAEISALAENQQNLDAQIESVKRKSDEANHKLHEEIKTLDKRRALLEEAKDLTQSLFKVKEQGVEKRASKKSITDLLDGLRNEIGNLKSKLAELKAKLEKSGDLQGQSEKLQLVLKRLREEKETLQSSVEKLLHERGVIQNQIEHLAKLKEEQQKTEQEQEKIQQLHAELAQLTEFYDTLKKELRLQNIKALEHYFNEFFHAMDSGASYRGVQVNEDYEITVQLKDGSPIRPELLSGGERALINIALRSAIHQVLSQATNKMPLILDEPTIYLDRERVSRLQFLLEKLGERVGQVIVVSHEIGLVEGAHHEYRTEKRPDNTSRIYRVR